MPVTLLALQILLILLPGLAAGYFVQAMATRRTQSEFERVVEALVFSFVIYLCFMPLNQGKLPFDFTQDAKGNDTVAWHPQELGWLAAITIVFSLLAVIYIKFDGNRIFRFLKLTEKTTNNSLWNDIFEHEALDTQPVQVELGDGRNVLGILLYYSDDADDASVFLKEASWVDKDGGLIPIHGPGILLSKNAQIHSISLLNPAKDSTPDDEPIWDEDTD